MVLISFSVAKEGVRNGDKEMTIRSLRKYPIKSGDQLQLYWKSRTKECEKLKDAVCLLEIKLDWNDIVALKYRNVLAKLDGFTDWYAMEKWFHETHKELKGTEEFQIICWGNKTFARLMRLFESERCIYQVAS